jgi:hypothetical protein
VDAADTFCLRNAFIKGQESAGQESVMRHEAEQTTAAGNST